MKPPPNTTKVLKAEAEELTAAIFRGRYCIVHFKNKGKQVFYKIEKHHLIHKGQSSKFKCNIWNILPVCENDHRWDNMSAHEAEQKFLVWVKDNLPLHWAWYQEHKNEAPHTLYAADWSEICDELRHYANHRYESEKLIYETI